MGRFEAVEDDHRLANWQAFRYVDDAGRPHACYRQGSGPGVIVLHEIPGITPEVAGFAQRLVDQRFTVVMPSLLGEPGRPKSGTYVTGQLLRACVSREFVTFLTNRTSAATAWLREMAATLHRDVGGPGVGVVGMCLTGGFGLAMTLDDAVIAPVLSQPSLPLPLLPKACGDLNLNRDDREAVRATLRRRDITVLGLRFSRDYRVRKARFDALRELLGDHFRPIEIKSGRTGNLPKKAHSVLTYAGNCKPLGRVELEEAANAVVQLFEAKLRPVPPEP